MQAQLPVETSQLLRTWRDPLLPQKYARCLGRISGHRNDEPDPVAEADREVLAHVRHSLKLIREWVRTYAEGELLFSWNGGKDCTVLFHLVRLALALESDEDLDPPSSGAASPSAPAADPEGQSERSSFDEDLHLVPSAASSAPKEDQRAQFGPILGLWLKPDEVFPELEQFIRDSAELYGLPLTVCSLHPDAPVPEELPGGGPAEAAGGPLAPGSDPPPSSQQPGERPALRIALPEEPLVARRRAPSKKPDYRAALEGLMRRRRFSAVLMAQRRSDPGCANLAPCAPSDVDRGWPRFDRLNPLLDWSYAQVWAFVQSFGVPVCRLYHEGYSSLGNSPVDTRKNPWLRAADGSYLPAWRLADEKGERLCRSSDDRDPQEEPSPTHD